MSRPAATRSAVALLSAQTLAFGVAAALLVIPGTSLFLDAYGSEWLPVSYIAVAVVGTTASWVVARAVRRFRLVGVATVALGAQMVLFGASWVVLEAGGRWISAVLLVAFPLAVQMGFVFVGAQAGRLLNIRELKELFPRIVSGFVIGFFIGGLLGPPILSLREEPQDLLLGATAAQAVFIGFLILTDRRFPALRAAQAAATTTATATDRLRVRQPVPLRKLLANRLVIVIFAYQVLSAMGSQLVDYLMFDRAANRYPDAADLTRWVSWFTAVVNLLDIIVLAVFAGYLLKRFGLRFGLSANPAAVAVSFFVMLIVGVSPGTATLAFLTLTAATRITDIVLTDGATRTSINATYQVLPMDERLAVQTTIEGVGVPAAIGLTGVVLLVLQALPGGTMVVVVVATVVTLVWTMVGWLANREYTEGLRRAVVERTLVDAPIDLGDEAEAEALGRLLRSDDGRQVTIGLDLLAGLTSPATDTELRRLLDDDEPQVRLGALAGLTTDGHLSTITAPDAATVIDALDGDGDLSSPVTLRAVRACRSLPPEVAIEHLARHIGHPDRAVGAVVLVALSAAHASETPAVTEVLRDTMHADGAHAARIIAARRALPLDRSAPLARALDDELDLLRTRAVAMLTIRHGEVARRAARAFTHSGADGRRQALALEALEVIAAKESGPALSIVRPDLDDPARLRALGGVDEVRSAPSVTNDLIADPELVWRSEWVAACALHHREHSAPGAVAGP